MSTIVLGPLFRSFFIVSLYQYLRKIVDTEDIIIMKFPGTFHLGQGSKHFKNDLHYKLGRYTEVMIQKAEPSYYYKNSPAGYELCSLRTHLDYRNRGHAGKSLLRIISWADYHQHVVYLYPCPYGEGERLNRDQLFLFYKEFGFKKIRNYPDTMKRIPNHYA